MSAPSEDTVAGYLEQVAQAARDRAGAWDAVADVLEGGERAAARLRDGSAAAAWRASSRWLGDDAELFVADLYNLDVYERGAARRSPEDDVAALGADHAALVAPDAAVVARVREVAAACRDEAEAWAGGDTATGKSLRLREQELIEGHLVPVLPDLGGRLAREAGMGVWRALGRLVLAVLSVESGRDFQRAVLGEDLGRHRA
ncbi:hypothetical protein [Georgenia ruanii]|uniref:hypothetical protein n=1 Tax=Georgenia ruanii TaxID=348442 RepID=UPI0012654F42|nr:hypothetical protein [Georgenia ruanii]